MTVKVIVDWQTIRVKSFSDRTEAFNYAQSWREAGFKVTVS